MWLALRQEPDIKKGVVTIRSDNTSTVQCLYNQGSMNPSPLLRTSEILLEEAHRKKLIYLFPPPQTQVVLLMMKKLEHFKGKVLLIAPYWERQPWFPMLIPMGPRHLPLPLNAITQVTAPQLMTSLRLHGWSLSN